MVSAICPNCNIALVEANSASFSDLSQAVEFAKTISGVVAISNSYGASEFSGELAYNTDYSFLQGIAMTASSGDGGYGVEYPAASPYLTAVGGTTLTASVTPTSLTWSQTVWSGAGSGCSVYESQPTWQGTWNTACSSNRTVADTSADANPNTGVAVYDSFHEPGWMVFGGTSVSSPTIASVYALAAGSEGTLFNPSPAQLYQSTEKVIPPEPLYNVISGFNGTCETYLCNASSTYSPTGMPAYDGPTGNGTPNGSTSLSAF